jgi:hypothetical protein
MQLSDDTIYLFSRYCLNIRIQDSYNVNFKFLFFLYHIPLDFNTLKLLK